MANLKDIERRIASNASTRQITKTMEMVAAAKIKRASDEAEERKPFADALYQMVSNTVNFSEFKKHPIFKKRESVKTALLLVITSDRGLAGGFNNKVLREAQHVNDAYVSRGVDVKIIACGSKATSYFKYREIKTLLHYESHSEEPRVCDAFEIGKVIYEGYVDERLDEVVCIFNYPKNNVEQNLINMVLLPIPEERLGFFLNPVVYKREKKSHILPKDPDFRFGAIEFEPDEEQVMDFLIKMYIRALAMYMLTASSAAEQGARMVAMKSATDSVNKMINSLTRLYNRMRQGEITTEINEIVEGAASLEGN
ncbi:MAG: ATP synthase F1 subunit gamma [Eggerthellaceae bacterium]|nr:ATP synthase F1 subunit gamma [Eggerthellaceae bacterium]